MCIALRLQRLQRLLGTKSKILFMKGEESLRGLHHQLRVNGIKLEAVPLLG